MEGKTGSLALSAGAGPNENAKEERRDSAIGLRVVVIDVQNQNPTQVIRISVLVSTPSSISSSLAQRLERRRVTRSRGRSHEVKDEDNEN